MIIPRRSQRQLGGGQLGQRRAGQEAANGAASMHPMKCTSVSRYRSRKDGDYSCEIKGGLALEQSAGRQSAESCAADTVLRLTAHARNEHHNIPPNPKTTSWILKLHTNHLGKVGNGI